MRRRESVWQRRSAPGLVGVAYILDEPSIGLHQRDNDKLLATLKHLRDLGNSLIVVEHDEDTMRAADCVVDIGLEPVSTAESWWRIGTAEDLMKIRIPSPENT